MENTRQVPEALKSNSFQHKKSNESAFHGEANGQRSDVLSAIPWISPKMGAQSHVPSREVGQRVSDMGRSQLLKDRHAKWEVSEGLRSDPTRNFGMNIRPSDVLERDRNAKKCLPQLSSEDISLYYKDPQGEIQGPFSGSDLIRWFEAGFFGIDLEVRLEGASHDTPFVSLGDAIPQLRAKERPPPGFSMAKQSETAKTLSGSNFIGLEKAHAGSRGTNSSWNEPMNKQEVSREADSKMLESLISGSLSCSVLEKLALSEGLQGYTENSSFSNLLKGVEKGNEQNLAQKFLLKQQWDLLSSRLLAASPLPQNVDLVSILQGLDPDFYKKTTDWSGSLGQGGLCTSQYMINSHNNQYIHPQSAYGIQEQMLQSQNQLFANTVGQYVEHSCSLATTENQQLLLEQQQKILQLLLQQQLPRQHEQNKCYQVLQSTMPVCESSSGHLHAVEIPPGLRAPHEMMQTNSHVLDFTLQDASTVDFASLPSQVSKDVVPGSHSIGNLGRVPYEMLHTDSGMPARTLEDALPTGFATLPLQVPEDVNYSVGSEAFVPLLPHQFFENITHQEGWDATLSEQLGDTQNEDFMASSADILEEPRHLKEQFDGDILVEAADNVSRLPLQPLTTNGDSSVNGMDYSDAKDTKGTHKRSERGKAVGMNAITPALTNVSVSWPIVNDAESYQKQEAVLTFSSDPNLGDFVHWKGEPAFQEASAQSKFTVGDDMSWGPLDQSNQEAMQTGIPSHGNFSSWVTKPTPVQGTLAGKSTRKKSSNSVPSVNSHSFARTATQSSQKGRKGAIDKHSEATEFRAWCESEIMRLTGSKDTTILEFCLRQPTSEAEMLLKDNLGSHDPDHMFIDTFLNHKELLSADVLEIAFQPHIDHWVSGSSSVTGIIDVDPRVVAGKDDSKGGWKKKVRKGRR